MLSPRAEYERQRAQVLEELREIAPEPLLSQLSDLLRPAIALVSSAPTSELPPLVSKFGREPDVPIGFEWPHFQSEPLGFVAQVNLAEVASFDLERRLPETGLLSFWMNEEVASF